MTDHNSHACIRCHKFSGSSGKICLHVMTRGNDPMQKTAEAVATAAAAGVATPAPTASEVVAFNRENLTKQSDNVMITSLLVLTLSPSIPVTGVNLALENPPAGSGMASWITTILWLKEKVTSCVLHRWQE